MAQAYVPAEKFLARKREALIIDPDVIYWKRMQQLAVFQEPSTVSSVKISPNKPYNIATTSSVRLTLYDNVVCEPLNMFSRFKQAVCSADFRHDGRLLAIGGDEGKVRIFDVEKATGTSKAALRVMQPSQSTVRCVKFSTRGDTVFSMADDGYVKQFKVADTAYGVNAVPLFEMKAHEDSIRCGAVSSLNEHIIVTGGYDHTVRVWDTRSKEKVAEMACEHPVESVIFLPGEQLLASASGNVVRIWDISAGARQLAALQAHNKTVMSLCLATNSTILLTGGIDRRINAFKTTNYSLVHSWSMPSPVLSLDISKDDKTLAIGMGNLTAVYKRADVKKEVAATSMLNDKRAIVRTAAPKVITAEKGGNKTKKEIEAASSNKLKLSREDSLLSGFKHAEVIRRLFNTRCAANDASVVGYLRVILMRNALHRALAGQDSNVQKNLLRFLHEHLFRAQYFDVLHKVALAFYEVYSSEDLDRDVIHQAYILRKGITRELEVQKIVANAIGAFELIFASAKNNAKLHEDDTFENDDVFGDVKLISKDLEFFDQKTESKDAPEV